MSKLLGTSLLILWLQSDWVKSQQKNGDQQKVKQNPPSLSVTEGGISILNCDYDDIMFNYFQWYRNYPSKSPTFLISIGSVLEKNEDGRFTVFHNRSAKHLSLHISASQPGDSALYLCAAKGEQNPLKFGKGTYLNVEPKSQPAASPSVFVMKNGTNVACLVKEFYPKEVTISLQSSKKIIEYEPAIVVSPGGRYSAVKLGQYNDPDSVTCSVEHNKKTWHSSDFEPKKDISETTPKPTESENTTEIQVPATCYEPQVQPGKVNMMSLSVLGLRMLFAKSVAVNFLFTAKLFFF